MWIEWKYQDHGHGDFEELEVPDDVIQEYGSLENYICEFGLVPTWSERFNVERIKIRQIEAPSKATVEQLIKSREKTIAFWTKDIERLKQIACRD
jgi:hypothetical protein